MRTVIAILILVISAFLLPGVIPAINHLAAGTRLVGPISLIVLLACGLYGSIALFMALPLAHLCCAAFLAGAGAALFISAPSLSEVSLNSLAFAGIFFLAAGYMLYDWFRPAAPLEGDS